VYVDDAFANVHRDHASMTGVTKHLPSVAGFLVDREVTTIVEALDQPKRPLLAVIGGAKIDTKIDVLNNLLPKVEHLLIGGAMANTFLAAEGHEVGKSLYEEDKLEVALEVIRRARELEVDLILPNDVVVAKKVAEDAEARTVFAAQVEDDDIIVDLGPNGVETALEAVHGGGTVIWNGPIGITEHEVFSKGSKLLAEGIIASGAYSIIGGGDTADFIDGLGLHDKFDFVSTGGGASLELMSGKTLPALVPIKVE
jgi:phosphoglycerate kinase